MRENLSGRTSGKRHRLFLACLTLTVLSGFVGTQALAQSESGKKPLSFLIAGAGITDNTLEAEGKATLYTKKREFIPTAGLFSYPSPFIDKPILRMLRWSVEIGASTYQVDYQLADRIADAPEHNRHNAGNEVDLGTEVSGFMAYLTPGLSLYAEVTEAFHAYLGFGVGVGFARLSGSYYDTDGSGAACAASTTKADVRSNCGKIDVGANSLGLAQSAFVGFRWRFIGFRYLRGGPTFKSDGVRYSARSDLATLFLQIAF